MQNWCRSKYARVESPDQALQLAQLASIHAHWTVNVEAAREEDTGPIVSAVAVESNAANLHLIWRVSSVQEGSSYCAHGSLGITGSQCGG